MKKIGNRIWVHRTAVHQLPAADQRRVERVSQRVPDLAWSVARVSPDDVMLGRTTSFDRCAHPALEESARWDGRTLTRRTYRGDTRPVYHRCEELLDSDHPRYGWFQRQTTRETRAGLLGRSDIGTVGAWRRAVRSR